MESGTDWLIVQAGCLNTLIDFGASVLDHVPVLRAIIASILIFFLPGFAWSFVFFNRTQINRLERAVLSVGLSIALVTLSMYALNLAFDVKVTGTNAVIDIIGISCLAGVFYSIRKYVKARHCSS